MTADPVVNAVIRRLVERSAEGMRSYGQTMAANPAPLSEWIQHAQEELLDAVLYLERAKAALSDPEREAEDAPAGAVPIWSRGLSCGAYGAPPVWVEIPGREISFLVTRAEAASLFASRR